MIWNTVLWNFHTSPEPWASGHKEMAERGYGGALQVIFFMATHMGDTGEEEVANDIWYLMCFTYIWHLIFEIWCALLIFDIWYDLI